MVCSSPMGSAWSPYARTCSASSTKRWRGIAAMIRSTWGSVTPRARSSSTIRRRAAPYSARTIEREAHRFQLHHLLVVGQLEGEGRQRDEARLHGALVARLVLLPGDVLAADPVVLLPARVLFLHDDVVVDPPAEPRDAEAADALRGERGDVDVEAEARREAPRDQVPDQPVHDPLRGLEVLRRPGRERDRDGGDPEERPLHRGGDGARV